MENADTRAIAIQMAEASGKGKGAYLAARNDLFSKDSKTHHIAMPNSLDWVAHTQLLDEVYTAFPDLREYWAEIVVESDKAIGRWTAHGTHKEEFQGTPATGKSFTVNGLTTYRCSKGHIVEQWIYVDMLSMLQQLEVIPSQGDIPAPPPIPDELSFQENDNAGSIEENKEIVRRYLKEVWENWDFDAEKEILAEDFEDHNAPPNLPDGLEGHHIFLSMCKNGFPEVKVTVDDLIAEGNKVGYRWSLSGEHQGEFMDIPPTGNEVNVTGMDIVRIQNSMIAEAWHVEDMLGMMKQLGVG